MPDPNPLDERLNDALGAHTRALAAYVRDVVEGAAHEEARADREGAIRAASEMLEEIGTIRAHMDGVERRLGGLLTELQKSAGNCHDKAPAPAPGRPGRVPGTPARRRAGEPTDIEAKRAREVWAQPGTGRWETVRRIVHDYKADGATREEAEELLVELGVEDGRQILDQCYGPRAAQEAGSPSQRTGWQLDPQLRGLGRTAAG